MKFSMRYPDGLTPIKRIHNLPPHMHVAMFLHYVTLHKCFLPLNSVSGSEKNRFWWVWSVSQKSLLCG